MPSLAAVLLAAVVQVPFGSIVTVHVVGPAPHLTTGAQFGSFLVAAPAHLLPDGHVEVELRPTALGPLTVPLPGDPEPASVAVVPTLDGNAPPSPVIVPRMAPPLAWLVVVAAVIGFAALFIHRRRERRSADLAAPLRGSLAPLADPAGWLRPEAADTLATAVRRFLAVALGAPFQAMTTREVAATLPAHAAPEHAVAFIAALEMSDAVRYSGVAPRPQTAAETVRGVLRTAALVTGPEAEP
ncbi:MAG: hypothetical protein ACM3O7_00140 [Acidobacteriota bacterium]